MSSKLYKQESKRLFRISFKSPFLEMLRFEENDLSTSPYAFISVILSFYFCLLLYIQSNLERDVFHLIHCLSLVPRRKIDL